MAKNYRHPGKVLDYTNSGTTDLYSGSVVVLGDIIGIAITNIPAGKTGSVQIEEVFKLPKGDTLALTAGTRVGWDPDAKQVISMADGEQAAGIVAADAAASAGTVDVKLNA